MRRARGFLLVAATSLWAACGGDGNGGTPAPVSYTVRVTLEGPGAVDVTGDATGKCQGSCSMSARAGGTVVLTAVPDPGAAFKGFSGACSGVSACTLSVNGDLDVWGLFEALPGPPATFTVTVERTGDGAGQVTSDPAGVTCAPGACSGTFESGTRVTLTATPDAGSRFVGWDGGGCSGVGTCELVLTAATTVKASFAKGAPGTYAIEVLSYPGGTLLGAAIDARGNVAGTFSASTCCESQVFLYDAATRRVTLPLPDQRNARCVTMSDAGVMLVTLDDGATYRVQDGETLSVIGAMTPYAMNDRGWVAGWMEAGAGPLHAAVDDGTTVRDLDPGATVPSTANGINTAGVIVGTRGSKAVVFEAAGPRDLAVPPASAALDVSDTGLVVGAANRTFKWTEQAFIADLASGAVTLVDHPSGTVGMSLDRTNRAGTIAVGQLFTSDGAGSGCVHRDGKLEPLEPLVELPPGVRILNTVDVNDAGQILVTLVGAQGGGPSTAILTPR